MRRLVAPSSWIDRVVLWTPLSSWILVCTLAVAGVAAVGGCSDDETPTLSEASTFLGIFTIPRGVPGSDPLLVDAYGDLSQAEVPLSEMRLSWGETEPLLGFYDWQFFENHAHQSRMRGIPLAVEVPLIDNQARGKLPEDLVGQWIDGTNLRVRFARFCRDLVDRSRGQVGFVWVGREVDVYLAEHPEDLASFRMLLSDVADSIHAVDPSVRVGTIVAFSEAEDAGLLPTTDAVAASTEWLGLTIYGRTAGYVDTLTPEETLERVKRGVARYPNQKVVVTETAFPGGSPGAQEDFLRRLTGYLDEPPSHLYGAVWHAITDYAPEEAVAVADPIYADEPARRDAYIAQLRSNGLKEVNGVTSPAWLYLVEWGDNRAVSPGVLSP